MKNSLSDKLQYEKYHTGDVETKILGTALPNNFNFLREKNCFIRNYTNTFHHHMKKVLETERS